MPLANCLTHDRFQSTLFIVRSCQRHDESWVTLAGYGRFLPKRYVKRACFVVRVRPLQLSDCRFYAKVAITSVSCLQTATHSGRFILSEQRLRNICRKVCQPSRILRLAGLARKHGSSDIKVTPISGLVATSFGPSVMQTNAG